MNRPAIDALALCEAIIKGAVERELKKQEQAKRAARSE